METILQSWIGGSDYSLDESKHKWHLLLMCCIFNDSTKGELSLPKSLNLSIFEKMFLLIAFEKCARKMASVTQYNTFYLSKWCVINKIFKSLIPGSNTNTGSGWAQLTSLFSSSAYDPPFGVFFRNYSKIFSIWNIKIINSASYVF